MDQPFNLDLVCRLCAKEDNYSLIDVFGEDGLQNNISKKIRLCLPIIVTDDDLLPKKICLGCLNKLDTSYDLYRGSMSAQSVIKKMYAAANKSRAQREPQGDGLRDDIPIEKRNVIGQVVSSLNRKKSNKNIRAGSLTVVQLREKQTTEASTSTSPPPGPSQPRLKVRSLPRENSKNKSGRPQKKVRRVEPDNNKEDDDDDDDHDYGDGDDGGGNLDYSDTNDDGPSTSAGSAQALTAVRPNASPSQQSRSLNVMKNPSQQPQSNNFLGQLLSNNTTTSAQQTQDGSRLFDQLLNNNSVTTQPNSVPAQRTGQIGQQVNNHVAVSAVSVQKRQFLPNMYIANPTAGQPQVLQSVLINQPQEPQVPENPNLGMTQTVQFSPSENVGAAQVYVQNGNVYVPASSMFRQPDNVVKNTASPKTPESNRIISAVMPRTITTPAVTSGPSVCKTSTSSATSYINPASGHSAMCPCNLCQQSKNANTSMAVLNTATTLTSQVSGIGQINSVMSGVRMDSQNNASKSSVHQPVITSVTSMNNMENSSSESSTRNSTKEKRKSASKSTRKSIPVNTTAVGNNTVSTVNNTLVVKPSPHKSGVKNTSKSSETSFNLPPQAEALDGEQTAIDDEEVSFVESDEVKDGQRLCPYCKKYFPEDIIMHHKTLHFRERFFCCIACEKNFRTEKGLENHRCTAEPGQEETDQ